MPIRETLKAPKGFLYPVRGLRLIVSDWRVFRFAILPFLVNTLLFAAFFLGFNYFAYEISSWVFQESSQQWYWYVLSTIMGVALFVVSIFVVMFGFVAVGLVVAAPFNDMLAAAVEKKLTGEVKEVDMSLWRLVVFTVKNETRKMAVILLAQGALLLINLVPGFGQMIFIVLSPLFLALVMAYEFTGYTLDRRGFSFSQKRRYITGRLGISLGFGFAVVLTLAIPIINFLTLPLAVAGGVLFVTENPPEQTPPKERAP